VGAGCGLSLLLMEAAFALNLLAVDDRDDVDGVGELSRCCREDRVEI